MSVTVQVEIEGLSRRRQALWFGAEPGCGAEADRIAGRLADLYEQKRMERARSGRSRTQIVRQARVESELERLMSEPKR